MIDLRTHRISADMFSDLAEGGGGAAAVDQLAGTQYSKHALLIRQVVESACSAGHKQAAQARQAYDLLAAVQDHHRNAVDAVLRHPPVGAWARRTVRMLRDARTRGMAVPAQLAAFAVAAAVRSGTDCTAEVPVVDGAVMLPSLGRIEVPLDPPHDQVRINVVHGRAEAAGDGWSMLVPADPSADIAGWQGLRRLSASAGGARFQVLIEDLDACRMPGSGDVRGRLSQEESDGLETILQGAWELLVSHHPALAEEVAATIRVFTPLLPPPRGQVSATSRDTFGSIALSAPSDSCSLAVTMAHETQHAKLSALLDVVPILWPDNGVRYFAPWRDDPRPLSGLLQGAYAFLGVTDFWRRQRRAADSTAEAIRAHAEFARWRAAVKVVVGTLAASGRLTRPGDIFVAGMARTLRSWAAEPVPEDAAALAQSAANEHLARWVRSNGPISASRRMELAARRLPR